MRHPAWPGVAAVRFLAEHIPSVPDSPAAGGAAVKGKTSMAPCDAAACAPLPLDLLRALADPCRIEILLRLGQCGEQDIEAIAQGFRQDRSVISRHLAALHAAGVLLRRPEGRRVLYRVDGQALIQRLEALTDGLRAAMTSCCPPPGTPRPLKK